MRTQKQMFTDCLLLSDSPGHWAFVQHLPLSQVDVLGDNSGEQMSKNYKLKSSTACSKTLTLYSV